MYSSILSLHRVSFSEISPSDDLGARLPCDHGRIPPGALDERNSIDQNHSCYLDHDSLELVLSI